MILMKGSVFMKIGLVEDEKNLSLLVTKYLVNKYSKMIVKIDRVFESFERIRAFEKLFVLNSLEYKILFYLAFKNEKC